MRNGHESNLFPIPSPRSNTSHTLIIWPKSYTTHKYKKFCIWTDTRSFEVVVINENSFLTLVFKQGSISKAFIDLNGLFWFFYFMGSAKSPKTTPANFKQKTLKSFTSDKISVLCFPRPKPIWNPISGLVPPPCPPPCSKPPSPLSPWTTSLHSAPIGQKVTNSNFTILFSGFTNILRASLHTELAYFIHWMLDGIC